MNQELQETGDPYYYKLEIFHFYIKEKFMESYQAVWKKYQQELILFPFQKLRESSPQSYHLHCRQPYNNILNFTRDVRNGIHLYQPECLWFHGV